MNFLGNIKKVITSYSTTNENFPSNQNPDNLVGGEFNTTSQTNSTVNLLKEESKFLKDKYNEILKENELLKQSLFTNSNQSNSQITKIFKEFKSAFFSYDTNTEANKSIRDFKNFLFQNLLLYNSVEEEDIDYLNDIKITDNDWNKNKDIFIFKQNLLERNYNQLMENLIVSYEMNSFLKQNNLMEEQTFVNPSIEKRQLNKDSISSFDNPIKNIHKSSFTSADKFSNVNEENKKADIKESKNNKNKNSSGEVKHNFLEDLIEDDNDLTLGKNSFLSKSNQEQVKCANPNLNKPFHVSNSLNDLNKNQKHNFNEGNVKQISNKNASKFEELFDPETEQIDANINLENDIHNHQDYKFKNKKENDLFFSNTNSSNNSTKRTNEVINDLLKDRIIDINSIVNPSFDKNNIDIKKENVQKNTNTKAKLGRIKSPLDDEEFETEENLDFQKINNNNYHDTKPELDKGYIYYSKNENEMINIKKNVESKIEKSESILVTPSKDYEDIETDSNKYSFKNEFKETETPYNTPINPFYNSIPTKNISNMKLGNI